MSTSVSKVIWRLPTAYILFLLFSSAPSACRADAGYPVLEVAVCKGVAKAVLCSNRPPDLARTFKVGFVRIDKSTLSSPTIVSGITENTPFEMDAMEPNAAYIAMASAENELQFASYFFTSESDSLTTTEFLLTYHPRDLLPGLLAAVQTNEGEQGSAGSLFERSRSIMQEAHRFTFRQIQT